MTTHPNPEAGWYADPHGTPNQLRWWDGSRWTEHTHADPRQAPQEARQPQAPAAAPPHAQVPPQPQAAPAYAPPQPQVPPQAQGYAAQQQVPPQAQGYAAQQPGAYQDPARVQRQVQQQAGVAPTAGGSGTLFTEPVLVVNQKAKIIELTNEYAVFDQAGRQIGSVAEVGQSAVKKAVRLLSNVGQFLTHKLEVRDAYGQPVLVLTRPAKLLKSRMVVERPDGTQVGEIVQQNVIGRINFGLMAGGSQVGAIKAENFRAWNFSIIDHTDTEVARITKTWEGLAKAVFTTADNYVLQIHRPLPDPLLSMVVASALTVDTALKQDNPSAFR